MCTRHDWIALLKQNKPESVITLNLTVDILLCFFSTGSAFLRLLKLTVCDVPKWTRHFHVGIILIGECRFHQVQPLNHGTVSSCSVSSPTWKINGGFYWCACCDRGVDQVRILQPEPSGERTWVRATKCHPLAVCQPPGLSHDSAEVSQVSQRLATAEETQVVCAEVPGSTEEAI